jgi:hypothetical protein
VGLRRSDRFLSSSVGLYGAPACGLGGFGRGGGR